MNKTLIVNEFLKFLETIEILRSENGCPWDKVQTPESMRGALIEEAIEASSAISEKNPCHRTSLLQWNPQVHDGLSTAAISCFVAAATDGCWQKKTHAWNSQNILQASTVHKD